MYFTIGLLSTEKCVFCNIFIQMNIYNIDVILPSVIIEWQA